MITKSAKKATNNNIEVSDVAKGLGGAYVGKKGLDHGLHRLFGLRGETHTTTSDIAKKIMREGGYLDPNFGGTGAASVSDAFKANSKGYVHITGYNNKGFKDLKPKFLKWYQPVHKKMQRTMYGLASQFSGLHSFDGPKQPPKEEVRKAILRFIKGDSKTFNIVDSENFYNTLTPDTDDIALKSAKKLKVYKSRLGATIAGIRKNGLRGLKSSGPLRPLIGAGVLAGSAYAAKSMADPLITKLKGRVLPNTQQ